MNHNMAPDAVGEASESRSKQLKEWVMEVENACLYIEVCMKENSEGEKSIKMFELLSAHVKNFAKVVLKNGKIEWKEMHEKLKEMETKREKD